MLITGHYYAPGGPVILSNSDILDKKFNVKVVGDISCDINGPISCTIRPSTIDSPIYGYNPYTMKEDDLYKDEVITVMAVDNLPCSLPRDASIDFGQVLLEKILPDLLISGGVTQGGTICRGGKLTRKFLYLSDYIK